MRRLPINRSLLLSQFKHMQQMPFGYSIIRKQQMLKMSRHSTLLRLDF